MSSQPSVSPSRDDIGQTTAGLRDEALARLGVTGDEQTGRLRDVLGEHGVRLYPLAALGVLQVVDLLFGHALSVFTPEISRSLGLSVGAIAAVFAVQNIAITVAPLPMAALAQRVARRGLLCLLTAFGWSLLTFFSGFVTSLAGLVLILVANGLTSGSVAALHIPLLMDLYPPRGRVRVLSAYSAVGSAGAIVAPLLITLLVGVFDLTWRGVFIAFGAVSTLGAVFALRLRDPGFGRWDTQQLRQTVREHEATPAGPAADDVALGFWEICRRLMMIPTVKRLLAGYAIFGVLTVPMATFFAFFLDRQWDLGPAARGMFTAYTAAVSVAALLAYGRRGEKLFRRDPALVVRASGILLATAILLIVLGALSPVFWGVIVCYGVAVALVAVLAPSMSIALMSITNAVMRPHLGALVGIFAAIGGMGGAMFLSGIEARFGIVGAMTSLAVPGVLGALVIASAARFIRADLERMIDDVLTEEKIAQVSASGQPLPLLSCHRVNFSYGQVQVLFDVDFTVDDGELVALLGTNGAGKSTLLKVISGTCLPTKGTIRLSGQDMTYLDAERRVNLGVTHVPGGRAVFGPLSVEENLRAFGHSLARNRRQLNARVDECFEQFPQLTARRAQPAAALSGGEQQMLALSKALILRPRLLLIDELSLGLAPVVVGQLLEMVRRINAGGAAVVLVEQSVNVALSVAEHAYFMEKGDIRFDGPSSELRDRDDLLRAVFLRGGAAPGGNS